MFQFAFTNLVGYVSFMLDQTLARLSCLGLDLTDFRFKLFFASIRQTSKQWPRVCIYERTPPPPPTLPPPQCVFDGLKIINFER